ncbi:MAG: SDR family NAD(P)-dependent oxidoreductase, partial [Acinetobacter sp.]
MKIEGKVFVVTGGASGLGAATATHLVGKGAKVIMVDMNQALGEEMQQRLGDKSKFVQLDVTDEVAVEQFFKNVEQDYGQLNGLINCAGIGPSAKVLGKNGIHALDA